MTKQDAIKLMHSGIKMTHHSFMDEKWLTIKDNKFLSEDGVKHIMDEFWLYRQDKSWEYGWSRKL